jgi:predicted ATPase/DNA-binding SARP family transcriptional activator
MGLSYSVLGPLEVRDGDCLLPLTRAKDRVLLATLLIRANQVVSTDRLLEVLWGDDPPSSGVKALQFHISSLRDVLNPGRTGSASTCLQTRSPGYVLETATQDIDAHRFRHLVDNARTVLSYDPVEARRWLSEALALWRGPALADFAFADFAAAEIRSLEEERLAAIELLYTAELALDHHVSVIPRLSSLATEHPYREKLHALLITALYRSGRQADALEVSQDLRRRLRDELGLDPSPEFVALESDVLLQSASLLSSSGSDRDGFEHRTTWAPVPSGAARRLGNLPLTLDRFVGRESELAEIAGLIGQHRLVMLAGPGGTGKTRLAVEATRPLSDRFADGSWFIALASVGSSGLVPTAMAEPFGLRPTEVDVDDLLVQHLRDRQALLVVDNCEHVLDGATEIVRRILEAAPEVTILATSREPLGLPGEAVLRVPTLGFESTGTGRSPAVELFIERARAARVGWSPDDEDLAAIEVVCHRVAGIPLGIELVAARIRSMTPTEILGVLDTSGTTRFASTRSEFARNRTLDATIDWSFQLLAEPERRVFRRLALFAGTFDLAAARSVCSCSEIDQLRVVESIDALVDRSLVVAEHDADGTRFRLLEPIRQWALGRLSEVAELDDVRRRHAHWYGDLIDRLAPLTMGHEQASAFRQIRADYPNIRVAFETLVECDEPDGYLDLAFGLYWFWAHEGLHLEGFERCLRGLDLAADSGADLQHQARVASVGTSCGAWTGRPSALDIADRFDELAAELGTDHAVGWALLMRGAVVLNLEGTENGRAGAFLEAARERLDAPDESTWFDPRWERAIQLLLYAATLPIGPARVEEFEEAADLFETVGDSAGLAMHYSQSLRLVELLGEERTADLLHNGMSISTSPSWASRCRFRSGLLHQRRGDHVAAVAELDAALRYEFDIGDTRFGQDARALAVSLGEIGRLHEAEQLMLQVIDAGLQDFHETEPLYTLAAVASLLAARGDDELAAQALGRAGGRHDLYVVYPARTRTRLVERLGEDAVAALEEKGAKLDPVSLLERVRSMLVPGTPGSSLGSASGIPHAR